MSLLKEFMLIFFSHRDYLFNLFNCSYSYRPHKSLPNVYFAVTMLSKYVSMVSNMFSTTFSNAYDSNN